MPPIHQKRENYHTTANVAAPRHMPRKKNESQSKGSSQGKTMGFHIPTIAHEVETDTQVATRAPPQSVLADNVHNANGQLRSGSRHSSSKENHANAGSSKLPPMKARNRPKSQGKQNGAFPTTFGNENVAIGGKKAVPMVPPTKPHFRVKSTKIYTTARSNQQKMQEIPSLHLPPTNQSQQHPFAVLPGSRRNDSANFPTLAEF